MRLEVGEKIVYENRIGESITGKIIGIARNNINVITTFTVALDSGQYVQIPPYNVCRC
jgi:ribosomal protein L35AE/L33A